MVVKISGEKNIPKLIFSSLFIYTGIVHRSVTFAIAQLSCFPIGLVLV